MKAKHERIAEIYHSARELRGQERARFLQEACGSDLQMLRQIETLLQQDETANDLLDQPAIKVAVDLMSEFKTVTWPIGTRMGPYELMSLVGAGGMGEVYRARDTRLGRVVALKLIRSNLLVEAQARRRFHSEARAVAGLSHRNIVALFDIGEFQGNDFLVMEYVEGRTLKELIKPEGLPLNDVVHYGTQIANALTAAHAAGIIHRDIKPANIMITPQSEVKILDFGLAKPAVPTSDQAGEETQQSTTPGMIVGTVAYMSPEQTRGMALDGRSDIFSLGCVLYEAATGRSPFQGLSALAIMHEIATAEPTAPSKLNVNLPRAFDLIIGRALAKNRDDRYQSCLELAEELDALRTTPQSFARPALMPLNARWAAVVLIVLVALAGLWVLRPRFWTAATPMVAVLPFEDLSSNRGDRYVSQGVTEDVIAQLGRAGTAGFGVINGTSVWRYGESRPNLHDIAADLGINYVLTGTLQREGTVIRMTARLIRTRDEVQVWADSFQDTSDNMLALQQNVALEAASAVATQLSLALAKTADRRRSVDSEVYDQYLRGRFYWNQRTEVSLKQAIDYFEQTIARARAYAPAYSGLADAYAALVYGCYLAPAEGFPKARAALQKARELDPESAEVFASEGYMNMYFDWDFPAAARNLKQAIALNPNYAPAHDWLGVLQTAMEDFTAASRTLERARVLDPGSLPILTDVGFELHYSKRNTEAEEALNRVFGRDPNFPLAHFWMGRVLHSMGDCAGALSQLQAVASSPLRDWQPFIAAHGHVAGSCGDREAALGDLHRLEDLEKTRFVTSYGKALIYAGLNDREQVLVWLRKAVQERSHWMIWSRLDPRFNNFRNDPPFQTLVHEVFPTR
jgi:serine/threonine protein kinase/tetratricopeptide (TPR) repeat protein